MRVLWALGIVLLLIGFPVHSESVADKEPLIRPAVEFGGAYYAYLPLSIGEFDRTMWLTHVAAVARLPMGFSAAARYDFGGIIYSGSGHVFRHGPGFTTRYAPFETRAGFLAGFFVGVEIGLHWIQGFRSSPVFGASIVAGLPLRLGSAMTMTNAMGASWYPGEAAHIILGFRNAMVLGF